MSTIPGTASGTEVDKATLLETLRRGEEAFLHSVAGVSEVACRLRPAENRWSVLECAEHVAVAEEVMLGLVTGERRLRKYECLLLMGSHAQRHALQIEEIKSSPAYRTGART